MDYLLDTHALIWFMDGDIRLSPNARNAIISQDNRCVISIAGIWEIAIKQSLGKLNTKVRFDEIATFLSVNNIEVLPIEFTHLQTLLNLEFIHRDPFDRIIAAQAIADKFTIITVDKHLTKYPVKCLW